MQHKHLLAKLIDKFFPDNPVGVEIGVDHGETTRYLLRHCKQLCHLYAVDPWIHRDSRYEIVKQQLSRYDNCTLIRKTSHEAACEIPDELDFIFVDGNHSFKGVLSDLRDYVPKIKSGGLLTGHDWTCVRSDFGVVQACEKYFLENENVFQPLYSNDALKNMGLEEFKRGGWSEKGKRHLIHKKRPSAFPLWWVVKR